MSCDEPRSCSSRSAVLISLPSGASASSGSGRPVKTSRRLYLRVSTNSTMNGPRRGLRASVSSSEPSSDGSLSSLEKKGSSSVAKDCGRVARMHAISMTIGGTRFRMHAITRSNGGTRFRMHAISRTINGTPWPSVWWSTPASSWMSASGTASRPGACCTA